MFKLAEETEVDQEQRGQSNTYEDGTNLKRLTTWSRGRPSFHIAPFLWKSFVVVCSSL